MIIDLLKFALESWQNFGILFLFMTYSAFLLAYILDNFKPIIYRYITHKIENIENKDEKNGE